LQAERLQNSCEVAAGVKVAGELAWRNVELGTRELLLLHFGQQADHRSLGGKYPLRVRTLVAATKIADVIGQQVSEATHVAVASVDAR
jgi:hypothetical protein